MLALATGIAVGITAVAAGVVTNGAASDEHAVQTCKGPFVGRSARDIQTATHTAAVVAVKRSAGACKGKRLLVERIDLLIENPHVKEYRVTLGGTG